MINLTPAIMKILDVLNNVEGTGRLYNSARIVKFAEVDTGTGFRVLKGMESEGIIIRRRRTQLEQDQKRFGAGPKNRTKDANYDRVVFLTKKGRRMCRRLCK